MKGIGDPSLVAGLCERNQISASEFLDWHETSLTGATQALACQGHNGQSWDAGGRESVDVMLRQPGRRRDCGTRRRPCLASQCGSVPTECKSCGQRPESTSHTFFRPLRLPRLVNIETHTSPPPDAPFE